MHANVHFMRVKSLDYKEIYSVGYMSQNILIPYVYYK